ncbi:ImmA/IrrE family metallo-endopeptidase [Paenibacillus pabuli]|uniref:ImmA/IrrE family metallo-endopeptidase n=1 Tax=Paenibacillus pabuli TaxID=1472 RepID=UPI003242BAAA
MIKSDIELTITQDTLKEFMFTLQEAQGENDLDELGSFKKEIYLKALEGQVEELTKQVEDYENLKNGVIEPFKVSEIMKLPNYIIRKRIASGRSLEELSEYTGIDVRQLEEYEEELFVEAPPSDLAKIIKTLQIPVPTPFFSMLQVKLIDLKKNIAKSLKNLETFILPEEIKQGENQSLGYLKLFSRLKGIYDEYAEKFLLDSSQPIQFSSVSSFKYKVPKGVSQELVYSYTTFATYLAKVVSTSYTVEAASFLTDYRMFKEQVLRGYGILNLESCVNYMWDLGIPVIPLKAKGGFHGACWRSNGKNVIILKQQANSEARWLFDLLHEYWHATQEPELEERSVVDFTETLSQIEQDSEEIAANNFASDVLFNGKRNELIEACYEEAQFKLAYLKNAVINISNANYVDTGSLANFVAYDVQTKVKSKNQTWWGAAQTLQNKNNPHGVVLKVLEERLDFNNIEDKLDREMVINLIEAE